MNETKEKQKLAPEEEMDVSEELDGAAAVPLMAEKALSAAEGGEMPLPTDGQQAARGEHDGLAALRRELALRSAIRAIRERENAQKMEAALAEKQAFVERDLQAFMEKHPEVDLLKLEENPVFLRFCGSRYGVESLAALYEDYREIVEGAEKAARAAVQSRSRRSTGSGGGGSGDILTAMQRARLEAWNRANPDMKMSAREFLKG